MTSPPQTIDSPRHGFWRVRVLRGPNSRYEFIFGRPVAVELPILTPGTSHSTSLAPNATRRWTRNSDPFLSTDFLAREKELLGDDAALFESAVGGAASGSGATIEDDFGEFDSGVSAVADAATAFVGLS